MISALPSYWLRALLLALLAFGPLAGRAEVPHRSKSGQFIVYSEDRDLRTKIVSYAQELKTELLRFLRADDVWDSRIPSIVITMVPAGPTAPAHPVEVKWTNTPGGAKVDVIVRLGGDPSNVFLQRHLVRAMLLEMSFRDRPGPKSDEPYLMPPWWLVEGIIENLRRRETGEDRDIFKSIVETQKVPPLDKWLAQPPANLETAAGAVDRACAMCLVDALLALPNGSGHLQHFIAAWPGSGGNALGTLTAEFPSLVGSEQSLAKWWLLQMARYAAGDRLRGMTLADTEQALAALLTFELPVNKEGKLETFDLKDFPRYIKLPVAKNTLQALQVKLVTLGTNANPILREVVQEYAKICLQLTTGKTRKIADRLAENDRVRALILQRSTKITDYLNWYEATQPVGRSNSFLSYLKQAEKMEERPLPVDPRITEYLNGLEQDFAPVVPGAFPEPPPMPPLNGTTVYR